MNINVDIPSSSTNTLKMSNEQQILYITPQKDISNDCYEDCKKSNVNYTKNEKRVIIKTNKIPIRTVFHHLTNKEKSIPGEIFGDGYQY